ncbi:hypothetical protein [Pseudomonas sp. HY13-MNA-CIBAN-0226]|uniref:hypothetical protein n=1 Tax=Pseudomonas sp. HY13-MNA-CIBAN-0226 TaxID=3140473 RepID=UPI0033249B91
MPDGSITEKLVFISKQGFLSAYALKDIEVSKYIESVKARERVVQNNLFYEYSSFRDSSSLFGVEISPVEFAVLKNNPVDSNVVAGAVKVAAEFKAKAKAKAKANENAIAEFNTFQEIALKETDPAVKALIKQAADLKLASYTK